MKIKRMVKHSDTEFEIMEFELTSGELTTAYKEKQEEYDKADCQKVYDAEFEKCSVEMTDEVLTRCARFYRKEVDDSGEWYAHAKGAVSVIVYLVAQEKKLEG